jgi:hypothetical protein
LARLVVADYKVANELAHGVVDAGSCLGRCVHRLGGFPLGPDRVDHCLEPACAPAQQRFKLVGGLELTFHRGPHCRVEPGDLKLDLQPPLLGRHVGDLAADALQGLEELLVLVVEQLAGISIRAGRGVRLRPGHEGRARLLAAVDQCGDCGAYLDGGFRLGAREVGEPLADLRGHPQPVTHLRRA